MIKKVFERVWAFDLEWVPDPVAGRLLYSLPDGAADSEVLESMWRVGGATEAEPRPFLKTVLCRIISIAVVERRAKPDGEVSLALISLPHDPASPVERDERRVVGTFLDALGKHRPQVVGYNSHESDLRILVQRAVVLGLTAPGFARRPEKPWEGVDYFARGSDWNLDLREMLGGFGRTVPSLHELAVQSGVPGKLDVDGHDVARMWLAGQHAQIVAYNEMDALTTYLVWLRTAHFAGHFSPAEYADEQAKLRESVSREIESGARPHLARYLEEWDRLQKIVARRSLA